MAFMHKGGGANVSSHEITRLTWVHMSSHGRTWGYMGLHESHAFTWAHISSDEFTWAHLGYYMYIWMVS